MAVVVGWAVSSIAASWSTLVGVPRFGVVARTSWPLVTMVLGMPRVAAKLEVTVGACCTQSYQHWQNTSDLSSPGLSPSTCKISKILVNTLWFLSASSSLTWVSMKLNSLSVAWYMTPMPSVENLLMSPSSVMMKALCLHTITDFARILPPAEFTMRTGSFSMKHLSVIWDL